jgi:hypothetical protein
MKKSTPASSQPSVPEPAAARDLSWKLEDLEHATLPKLALLIRWSEAESLVDRGGTSKKLEQLAWRGMEMLGQDVLREIEAVFRDAGVREDGFAMLSADEDGGSQ